MTGTALVLAAHGSRHEPAVNEQIRDWARQIISHGHFDEVAVTFHQGKPAFSEVLDSLTASEVTVVPLMTSAGYYSDMVLPRELARNRRYAEMSVRQTAPIGMHAAVPRMIADRSLHIMEIEKLSENDCTIVLVGHGTPRHPASRNATFELAAKLAGLGFAEVVAVFLDDEPKVDRLLEIGSRSAVIVVPFLIGAGPHATSDIPRRIGMTDCTQEGLPIMKMIGGKKVYCDRPLGAYPEMVDLIVELAAARVGIVLQREVA